MKPHPLELHAKAARLRDRGWNYNAIARYLGVGNNTVHRWLKPEYREHANKHARLRKEKYRGVCQHCGAPTSYSGKNGQRSSLMCKNCAANGRLRIWTRERIIEAIQRWAREHEGRPPAANDWINSGEYWPAASCVHGRKGQNVFLRWNDAIAAAGFTPRRSSPGPGNITWDREEARRLRELGYSDHAIAKKFGVTASAIAQSIGPRGDRYPATIQISKGRTRDERIEDLRKALLVQENT